jgi:hypothetical protein
MANTVVAGEGFLNITFDGATAFDITSATLGLTNGARPNGIRAKSLQFIPAATDNILIVREGSASGPIIFKGKAADVYDHKVIQLSGKPQKLYVVGAEATATVTLIVEI